jgi:demethylmenaquinone methyltransferase/2-methoxy-6-polyprenyl-1,4-benzoquinol methylase
MTTAPPTLDKSGRAIREMFAGVAPRYDLLNRLLSGRQDVAWRKAATRALAPKPGERVLDLCCGTGDQALTLARSGARVVAADFCLPMLALTRTKEPPRGSQPLALATADALALPFPAESFDGVTVSFGLRNVADLDLSLREMARVLRPGGRAVVLECSLPRQAWIRGPYLFYFLRILPRIGRLLSPRASAYEYLPNSVLGFPNREAFTARMTAAGFEGATFRDLTLGTVCVYHGRKRG